MQFGEIFAHMKKRTVANKAPGLDGFKATFWKGVPDCMVSVWLLPATMHASKRESSRWSRRGLDWS